MSNKAIKRQARKAKLMKAQVDINQALHLTNVKLSQQAIADIIFSLRGEETYNLPI